MAHEKKHKQKKAKPEGTLAFIGAILWQAIGQASRALRKKRQEVIDAAQAVAP